MSKKSIDWYVARLIHSKGGKDHDYGKGKSKDCKACQLILDVYKRASGSQQAA